MKCYICAGDIPQERVDFLKESFGQSCDFQCVECASKTVRPYKGLFFGSSGAPELRIVRDVSQTSGIHKVEEFVREVDSDIDIGEDTLYINE